MISSLPIRFQRFPYVVIGWLSLAALSIAAPDRLFLTQRQGIYFGLALLGIALMRGSQQIGDRLPLDIGVLTLTRLPRKAEMQYVGHGFTWTSQSANELLAAERNSALAVSRDRTPGDVGGVGALHALGAKNEEPVFVPLSDLEGH